MNGGAAMTGRITGALPTQERQRIFTEDMEENRRTRRKITADSQEWLSHENEAWRCDTAAPIGRLAFPGEAKANAKARGSLQLQNQPDGGPVPKGGRQLHSQHRGVQFGGTILGWGRNM